MKKVLIILVILSFGSSLFAWRFYEYLTPPERKVLSGEYKEIADVFLKLGKNKKYLNSLRYSVELYPMSDYAKDLAKILSSKGIKLNIDPEYQKKIHLRIGYRYFRKRNYRKSLNAYLMVSEIDPACGLAYLMSAKCYYKLGRKDKASEFVQKALDNGVKIKSVPVYLRKLIKKKS